RDLAARVDRGRRVSRGDIAGLRRSWQLPRVTLHFNDDEPCTRARAVLAGVAAVQLLATGPRQLVISTSLPTGVVLGHLDGLLRAVSSVQESTIPLRDLLTEVLASSRTPAVVR